MLLQRALQEYESACAQAAHNWGLSKTFAGGCLTKRQCDAFRRKKHGSRPVSTVNPRSKGQGQYNPKLYEKGRQQYLKAVADADKRFMKTMERV